MREAHLKRGESKFRAGNDPVMPGLDRALDCRHMQRKLAALAEMHAGINCLVRLLSSKLIRHKPGRRCIVQYELDIGRGNVVQRQTLLGKMRARGFDRRTYELTRELWRGEFGPESTDAIRVPEPVGAIPELNMWLQRRIEVRTLAEQLDMPNAEKLCKVAAIALHKLHSTGPRVQRRHNAGDEIRILNTDLDDVKKGIACHAERIDYIQRACQQLAKSLDDFVPATLHRDFYPNQLLVDGRSGWLLDLDLYAEGDSAVDLGNFVAHLQEMSLRRFGHCYAYEHLERTFLEAYREASGRELNISIQAYVTLTLARHIAISRRIPSRYHTTETLIRTCEHRLNLASANSSLG